MPNNISYKSDSNVKVGQLILKIGGIAVAYATSAQLTISTDVIDTSNKMDGPWKSGLAGKKSYTVNSEALLTEQEGAKSYKDLVNAQIVGQPIAFEFGTMKSTEGADGSLQNVDIDPAYENYSGNLIITQNDIQSKSGDLAKHTFQAQGSGPLTQVAPVAG